MRLEIVKNCPRSPTRLATIAQVRQAPSRTGDPNGSIVHVRKLMDQNDYRRLPALTPADVAELPPSTFGLSRIKEAHETWRSGRFNKLLAQVQDRVQEPDRVD